MPAPSPHCGLSLLPSLELLRAYNPLFSDGLIETLEHTVDAHWRTADGLPSWMEELLAEYSRAGRLLGHCFGYSLFHPPELQRGWLERFTREAKARPSSLVSAHYGLQKGSSYALTSPFPVPHHEAFLRLAKDQLLRLRDAAGCPVGVENLALAFHRDDLRRQGDFLDEILEAVQGFLLLDAHNVYCQAVNFSVPVQELLAWYPLSRVRVVHVSGGSWAVHQGAHLRRDTHDAEVPPECFAVLEAILARAPSVEHVLLERMPGPLTGAEEGELRDSWLRIRKTVAERKMLPPAPYSRRSAPLSGHAHPLAYQDSLLKALSEAAGPEQARQALLKSVGAGPLRAYVEAMEDKMLDIALELMKKWARPGTP